MPNNQKQDINMSRKIRLKGVFNAQNSPVSKGQEKIVFACTLVINQLKFITQISFWN